SSRGAGAVVFQHDRPPSGGLFGGRFLMVAAPPSSLALPLEPLHTQFLGLLPNIEAHARIFFRHVPCADQKADKIAETVALAWKWLVRLHERGKDVNQFPKV